MKPIYIVIIAAVVLLLGIIVFPLINRRQFRNLPPDQQIRIIMKEAKGLAYLKMYLRAAAVFSFMLKTKEKYLHFLG